MRAPVMLVVATALVLGTPFGASAQQVSTYADNAYDANGLNDQLEGTGSIPTPGASNAHADFTRVTVTTRYALRGSTRVPVATVIKATLLGTPDRTRVEVGYEMRGVSARCGSFSGVFFGSTTTVNDECDKSKTRISHPVAVSSSGRDLFITLPYNLNSTYGFLAKGDVLSSLQLISTQRGPVRLRLDWANAGLNMKFTVGT